MKTFEFTEEQIKMLKVACLLVITVIETDNERLVKYNKLYDYLNS